LQNNSLILLIFRRLISLVGVWLNKKAIRIKYQGMPFECGVNVLDFREVPIRMRFFILAVVFLIFDVELVLLIPFMLKFFVGVGVYVGVVFIIFLLILLIGVYVE
jgi:NADH-ubiquinone oxidoreductase chain 3